VASPLERAIKQMAWELETRKSVELTVRHRLVYHDTESGHPEYDVLEDHYIEVSTGQRACENLFLKLQNVEKRYSHFSDGFRCADVMSEEGNPDRQQSVFIKRQYWGEDRSDRMERPEPIQLLYVCREPLHKALPRAAFVGTETVLDRECDVFLFRRLRWEVPQDHLYYLDKRTSIPLKVESFRDEAARKGKQPMWVWTAESLDNVQGHFVPLKSLMVRYSNTFEPKITWKSEVLSIEFDKDFTSSTFWPTIQPGVSVHDYISGKHYRVPGREGTVSVNEKKAATIGQPIVAIQPTSWVRIIPSISLGLGLSVLLTAAFLWLRRR
jgi:hypothetical protein